MKRVVVFLVAACVCASARASAATADSKPAALDAAAFQQALEQRVTEQPGVGIIVGIIDHGRTSIFTAGSSGTARPLDEHTLFEIGSVTKTFTATILAGMVLDGSVSLDDPVSKYVPKDVRVPSRDGKQITLLNLATQHSGLPRLPTNMQPANPNDPYADYSLADLYAFLDSYRLTRDPGAQFEYSNLGVGLLGDALANRAGESYAQLLHDRVLAPLHMDDTWLQTTARQVADVAAGHNGDGTPVPEWNFQALAPAGAIRSSLADMLKYLRCNLGQGPLAKACLFAQQPRDSFPGNQIGLIWWTDDTTKIIHHGGDTAGYHAGIAISPDHTRGAVVLSNGGTPVEDVAMHVIDPSLAMFTPPAIVQLAPSTLDDYVGTYTATEGQRLTFTILRNGDQLRVQLTGQPFFDVYPSAKDHFFYRVVDAQIDFTREASGKVNALVLHQNGITLVAVKAGMKAPPIAQPSFPPVATLDSQTLQSYVGTYTADQGLQFTVTLQGTQLMVQLTGQPAAPVYPSAKDHFYYKIVNAQIDFERDADGNVTDLILHQNGQSIKALRAQPSS
jgi:D-alanyl-D-alanine-carboxypeptidase/D-alanyl-D-alanine-endopeptidase